MAGLFLIGCNKKDSIDEFKDFAHDDIEATATMNDSMQWIANDVRLSYNATGDSISIFFEDRINSNCIVESIRLENIPVKLNSKTTLYNTKRGSDTSLPTAYYEAMDCDAIGEQYNLSNGNELDNYLIIEKMSDGFIKGSFRLTLIHDKDGLPKIIYPNRPVTLRLTNGKFKGEL